MCRRGTCHFYSTASPKKEFCKHIWWIELSADIRRQAQMLDEQIAEKHRREALKEGHVGKTRELGWEDLAKIVAYVGCS